MFQAPILYHVSFLTSDLFSYKLILFPKGNKKDWAIQQCYMGPGPSKPLIDL